MACSLSANLDPSRFSGKLSNQAQYSFWRVISIATAAVQRSGRGGRRRAGAVGGGPLLRRFARCRACRSAAVSGSAWMRGLGIAISDRQLSIVTVTFPAGSSGSSACSFGFEAQEQSAAKGLVRAAGAMPLCLVIRGELASGRGTARHTLVFGGSDADPDHDAVIRIGGEAPRRRAPSLRRPASHACLRPPPPRAVMGIALLTLSTERPIPHGRLLHHGASRCPTQNHACRNLPSRHQPPKGDKQLAGQGDNHGLASAAAGIRRLSLIPLHQRALLLEH